MSSPPTRVDSLIERIKNHKFLSVLIVAGVAIIGTASVFNAISEISRLFVPAAVVSPGRVPETQPAELMPARVNAPSMPDSTRQIIIGDYEVTFAGSNHLTNLQGYAPEWSSNGRMIVYCSRNYAGPRRQGADVMISRDGGQTGEVLLTSPSVKYAPRFSYDDRYVAVLIAEVSPEYRWDGRGSLSVIPAAGGDAIQVAGPDEAVLFDLNYATNYDWSPMGNALTFVTYREVEGGAVYQLELYDLGRDQRTVLFELDDRTADFSGFKGRLPSRSWQPRRSA